ncbi:pyridoxamine 5'-phosphate oxidase [Altererythrobacter aerius]|uniref:Pyridoxamine 5'-phosphate oxidase n=1 Tax=Tsuneonella aeria TaxID=1837929 RepID=A0A6I4TFX9_9SPHN|nr:pyridoxamine 5'-phosphate oxidase family protein [Tsuneonella aeria]MXO76251.1 pyridoxamine 5'-phosphate oxidase [Tsuneonella aeria]
MAKSLADISKDMKQIDFCTLVTHAPGGTIGARPMSNNSEVDFDGDSWFFTYEDRQMVADIERDANVGLTYLGSAGLKGVLGAPGQYIHVEGKAQVIRDKARFAEHWTTSLDRWFPQGVDTPGMVMLQVTAGRIHYWDGEDEGEVSLPDRKVWTEGP